MISLLHEEWKKVEESYKTICGTAQPSSGHRAALPLARTPTPSHGHRVHPGEEGLHPRRVVSWRGMGGCILAGGYVPVGAAS